VGAAINRQSSAEDVVNSVNVEEDAEETAPTAGQTSDSSQEPQAGE
jgi:hypothetical protein